MPDIVCTCIYKTFEDSSVSLWSTALEFLLSAVIGAIGIVINYRFIKKLKDEKRKVPLGRKGNVIEPIMNWFCQFQLVYWPYHLTFFWIVFNGVIPTDYMNGWWCNVSTQIGIKFGRMYIAYNSLFVALIRYIYIVHRKKLNQWDFEKVGKCFQIASVMMPLLIEMLGLFVNPYEMFQEQEGFNECIAHYAGLNTTEVVQVPTPYPLVWTLRLLPQSLVTAFHWTVQGVSLIVGLNFAEFVMYFYILKTIQRYLLNIQI